MNTIHMDIDAMRRNQNNLEEIQRHIQTKILALRRSYQSLPHNWVGNSANEYFDNYAEFDNNLSGVLERLGEIASELSAEIANYERMDKGLSG